VPTTGIIEVESMVRESMMGESLMNPSHKCWERQGLLGAGHLIS
jgi:hypothetical protein